MNDKKKKIGVGTQIIYVVVFWGTIIILIHMWLFSGENNSTSNNNESIPGLNPEDIITVGKNAFACDTEENISVLISHIVNGEKTLLNAMFDNGTCVFLSQNANYKVLSTSFYFTMGGTVDEIVPSNSNLTHGYQMLDKYAITQNGQPYRSRDR